MSDKHTTIYTGEFENCNTLQEANYAAKIYAEERDWTVIDVDYEDR